MTNKVENVPDFKICEECKEEKELEVFSVPKWIDGTKEVDMNICHDCFTTLCFQYYNDRSNFICA